MYFRPFWAFVLLLSCIYSSALADDPSSESKSWGGMAPAPSENECRSFIEAALKEQRSHGEPEGDEISIGEASLRTDGDQSEEDQVIEETTDEGMTEDVGSKESDEIVTQEQNESIEESVEKTIENETDVDLEGTITSSEVESDELTGDIQDETTENVETGHNEHIEGIDTTGVSDDDESNQEDSTEQENTNLDEENGPGDSSETENIEDNSLSAEETDKETADTETLTDDSIEVEGEPATEEATTESSELEIDGNENTMVEEGASESEEISDVPHAELEGEESIEKEEEKDESLENQQDNTESSEQESELHQEVSDAPLSETEQESAETGDINESTEEVINDVVEEKNDSAETEEISANLDLEETPDNLEQSETTDDSSPEQIQTSENENEEKQEVDPAEQLKEESSNVEEQTENIPDIHEEPSNIELDNATEPSNETVSEETVVVEVEEESPEQEDLTLKIKIPANLRSRNHISEVLRLDRESVDLEAKILKAEETTLRELKRIYEAAIKPLEILYKYRDLSNRHFGDPEIFSKPLILFMGPWSGGKSTIINYLMDNEYTSTALRTGAEPSPAYFNIVMWGERQEILDGTQLAADWTFSGLQKFGQGLLDRLRGLKMDIPLLEKVNIVEIPGILEIRKQVERLFPFNDACQWFIDRADIIFLVYDPAKLDAGPETEAILDQLKGREYQTKIILNKADQVKPEELMRVQGTLIWNISPLMSSTEPPVMYSTSLWSHPYQLGSPSRLLFAQEKAFLKDLRDAIDKRVENKISSARRFAVRVRNHAKMVDCYLTTYYNHKTFFGNKQKVSDDIIEHPQNYHIYEGLSTLTNISRYDLPDPDVYRDFFRLNPVYDFQQLSSTCTYFKGCPINRLDVAIAYDLPELVGKYKKIAEDIMKTSTNQGKM